MLGGGLSNIVAILLALRVGEEINRHEAAPTPRHCFLWELSFLQESVGETPIIRDEMRVVITPYAMIITGIVCCGGPVMPVEPAMLLFTDLIAHFLVELQAINRAPATIRTYATDLHHFAAFYPGPLCDLTATVLTQYLATLRHLAPASRARKQAALASFCAWATANIYLDRNPMLQVPRVRPDPPRRYGLAREQVEAILASIPKPKNVMVCYFDCCWKQVSESARRSASR